MNDQPGDEPDIDQQIRINELREAAREAAGGEMTEWESGDTPPEIAEAFWKNVLAYEKADRTCHFNQLEESGVELPDPDQLDDAQLTAKLWEVIDALAKLQVFLSQTDHLSDRELYEHLWYDTLREVTMDLPSGSGWTCHLALVSSGGDEDNELYLKYYADDEDRQHWLKDFPNEKLPLRSAPPYNRDTKLPQPPEP